MSQTFEPFGNSPGNLNTARESLYEIMWEHAGILRSHQSLELAENNLVELGQELNQVGLNSRSYEFNMSWQDHLNLRNQILVSQAIVAAAQTRTDSRGAHYLTDNPHTGSLSESRYTRVALRDTKIDSETAAVKFTRLQP